MGLVLALPASASAGPLKDAAEKAARDLVLAQANQSNGSRARTWTSIALIAGGGALAIIGGLDVGEDEDELEPDDDDDDLDGTDDGDTWEKVMLGGGIAAAGLGAILLMRGEPNPITTITTRPGRITIRHKIRF